MQIEFSPFVSDAEDMALNAADKKWILEEIKGSGWRKIIVFIKEWGVLGLVGGAIILAVVEWNHFTNDNSAFRQHTEDRLHIIEVKLDLQAALQLSPTATLSELAKLDQNDFTDNLPILRKAVESPVSQVHPSNTTLRQIAFHLSATSESTPDYWPAVLQFLRFASAKVAPSDVPPPGGPVTAFSNSSVPRSIVRKVTIRLDGGDWRDSTFINCRIVFTQNPVGLSRVKFINCAFEFPETDTPTPYLKNFTKQLLTADLLNVQMPKSS